MTGGPERSRRFAPGGAPYGPDMLLQPQAATFGTEVTVMTRIRPAATCAALALGFLTAADPGTAAAQMACGQRDSIVSQLQERYGETRRAMGFQEGRGIVEVWASDETGTWTIVITTPQGTTCLVAAGEAFQADEITAAADTPA